MEQNYCVDTKAPRNKKRHEYYLMYDTLMKTHLLIDEIYDLCIDNNSELARKIRDSIKNYSILGKKASDFSRGDELPSSFS